MTKHNFKPDYRKWWNKKDLTEDELTWVVLGLNPGDAPKVIEIEKNPDLISKNNDYIAFNNYIESLPHALFLADTQQKIKAASIWGTGKKDFIGGIYEKLPRVQLPAEFHAYLKSIGVIPDHLDHFKKHDQYSDDLGKWKLDDVDTEDKALSLLFGLEPAYFSRFTSYHYRHRAGEKISAEDKFFAHQYLQFLKNEFSHLGVTPFWTLLEVVESAKKHSLWAGSLAAYVRDLHDEGFIFRRPIYDALKKHKIVLSYSKGCWAEQFYRRWLKEGTWTLSQALHLFRGIDPRGEKWRHFHDLDQNEGTFSLSDHYFCWDVFDADYFKLDNRLYRHIAAGLIKPVPMERWKDLREDDLQSPMEFAKDDANRWHFRPQDIVKFFLQHIPYTPPEPLITVVLDRKDAKAYFPGRKARHITQSRASAELRLRQWMEQQIKEKADHPTREKWLEAAKAEIPSLSNRQFDRVWPNMATEEMKSPGRRVPGKAA